MKPSHCISNDFGNTGFCRVGWFRIRATQANLPFFDLQFLCKLKILFKFFGDRSSYGVPGNWNAPAKDAVGFLKNQIG